MLGGESPLPSHGGEGAMVILAIVFLAISAVVSINTYRYEKDHLHFEPWKKALKMFFAWPLAVVAVFIMSAKWKK